MSKAELREQGVQALARAAKPSTKLPMKIMTLIQSPPSGGSAGYCKTVRRESEFGRQVAVDF
jgi:hypothetical protein